MTPATLDHLRQYVIASARKIGNGFREPDEDWLQVAFFQTPKGLEIMGLANDLFASGAQKEVLGELLRVHARASGAYRYALLLNVHQAPYSANESEPAWVEAVRREELRVEQIEGATEWLLLLVGDAEEEQVWRAQILRRPRTLVRTMGRWERMDADGEFVSFKGRFSGLNAYMRL